PGEFTRRAYLNGKMDLDAAQAIQEIIDAKSATTLHAARRLQSGVFRTALLQLRSALMNLLADLNAELDFIDEDISFATLDNKLQILRSAIDSATKLIHDAERFNAYKDGVHIALVGKPNAGKSSLMNRLVGEERSIVSEIAGPTRDYIEGELTLAGFNVRLFDTAGLNEESSDPIEKLGIERTHRLIERAHILILLIDGTDNAFPKNIPTVAAGAYTIYAINKIDILPDIPREVDKIYISAKTGEGMPELTAAMEKHIYASTPQDAIPLHEWQQEILRRIVGHLTQAESALKANELAEVVSHLVQNAVTSIAELTGAIESEDILGRIFSRFCIGK
ncbi:MAG TPA: 50S ribosome-binding GTPase, partial [Turneriella sp.]|nr:50S ribosome-binding GTPase [Turneriella sp.]